jgi:inner membrane protein
VDNLTHSLVGLAAAKAGLGRVSPYATFVCVAAANLPDIDIVTLTRGPAFYLQHHRGITHSIVGMLALAVAFPMLFCAAERVWARARGREARARLKGLHPVLDWTNSYGVRPLLPWDGRWIYGDLLYVIDPWVWMVLGGTCFLLATSRLRAVGWGLLALFLTAVFFRVASRPDASVPGWALVLWCVGLVAFLILRWKGFGERSSRSVAAVALAFVVVYCGALSLLQAYARNAAGNFAVGLASAEGQRVLRVAATPVAADPFTWRCMADAERSTFRFNMRLNAVSLESLQNVESFARPEGEEAEAVRRASEDAAARVLLDFARFPVARVQRAESGRWVVQFADLRFTEPGARARLGGFALDVPVEAPAGR